MLSNRPNILFIGLIVLLLVFLIHSIKYFFLTDDAFIAYCYVQNFVEGNGLVYNIGENVEGYVNFLWIVILSMFKIISISPEIIAPILSILFGAILIVLVFLFNKRFIVTQDNRNQLWLLVAPLLLVINRSYAVWATGGLETRLFSLLIFTSFFLFYLESIYYKDKEKFPYSSIFFALSSLTRPEGNLVFMMMLFYLLFQIKPKAFFRSEYIHKSIIIYSFIVGLHFVFRILYYGEILPNIIYVKFTGGDMINFGFYYVLAFLIEYGFIFFIPLLFIPRFIKNNRTFNILFFCISIPYIVYLIFIGGDHFEWRMLDVLLPFIYIFIQETIYSISIYLQRFEYGRSYNILMINMLLFSLIALTITIPALSSPRDGNRRQVKKPVSISTEIPIFKSYINIWNSLMSSLNDHSSAVRQEEFLYVYNLSSSMVKYFREAKDAGIILDKDKFCTPSAGIIPYYGRIYNFDPIGLTTNCVKHWERSYKLVAHSKKASWEDIINNNVLFIAANSFQFFFPKDELKFTSAAIAEESKYYDKSKTIYWGYLNKDIVFAFRSPLNSEDVINLMEKRNFKVNIKRL